MKKTWSLGHSGSLGKRTDAAEPGATNLLPPAIVPEKKLFFFFFFFFFFFSLIWSFEPGAEGISSDLEL